MGVSSTGRVDGKYISNQCGGALIESVCFYEHLEVFNIIFTSKSEFELLRYFTFTVLGGIFVLKLVLL